MESDCAHGSAPFVGLLGTQQQDAAKKSKHSGGHSVASANMRQCIGAEVLSPRAAASSSGLISSSTFAQFNTGSSLATSTKPRFDMLRLREWFNTMDTDHSGHVQKKQWIEFLQSQPQLRKLLVGSENDGMLDAMARRNAEAKQTRKLLRLWKEIDADQSGTLEFEEFVECFRRGGFLIEYTDKNNPKERLAELLQSMHEDAEFQDVEELEEFVQLGIEHLPSERRRSLGSMDAKDALDALDENINMSATEGSGGTEAMQQFSYIDRRRNSLSMIAYAPDRRGASVCAKS